MDEILIRGIERIVIVLGGSLSIFLGYRLFINLPEKSDQSGEIKLPGNVSIYLSRVGPGVFFSLFGVAVLVASLYFQMTRYEPGESAGGFPPGDGSTGGGMVVYSYRIDGADDMNDIRNRISKDIEVLAEAPRMLNLSALDPRARMQLNGAIQRARLALVGSVWEENWGDPQEFVKRVRTPQADSLRLKREFPRAYRLYAAGQP